MQRLISDQSCKLYHTAYCDLLNMPTCEDCFVNKRTDADQVIADLDVLRSLMPAEGITHLFTGEECLFCKGRPNKRAYYAMLDMGHAEPVREKRTVIGMKTKTRVGSMLPVQVSTCAQCRKRIRTLDNLPLLLPLVLCAITLIVLMIGAVSEPLVRVHPALPFLIFLGVTLVGVVLGRVVTNALRRSYVKLTKLDPMEIPTIAHMRDKGWFFLSGKTPKMIFTKKRMRMGVGTGTREEAFCTWEMGQG